MNVKLKFRHIECFRSILQAGTATGAAKLLNVTQPAVSQLMTDMEGITGFQLFDRRGGRMVPTELALQLYEEVQRCYSGLDQINTFCDRIGKSKSNAIVVASIPSVAASLVPRAVRRYLTEVRKDFFSISSYRSHEALALVGSQKADIGFGIQIASVPGIQCDIISEYDAICVLPKGHHLARNDVVTALDLAEEPFIIMSRQEGVHDRIQSAFEQANISLNTVAECSLSIGTCSLVEQNVGVTLVDQGAASLFLEKDVVLRRFSPRIPMVFYSYTLTKGEKPHVKKFISFLQTEAEKMNDALEARLNRID